MIKCLLLVLVWMLSFAGRAQEIKAEFTPGADLSRYKTFMIGEGEIITPKDLRKVPDSVTHTWIRHAVIYELTKKGMEFTTAGADLVVSYVAGSQKRVDSEKIGPLGLTPGSNPAQTFEYDYRQASLIVDLNDPINNKLVWRVNASINTSTPDSEEFISQILLKGFRKFSIKPKKEKGKK